MFAVVPALAILVALGIQQAQTFIQGNKKLLFSVIVGFLYAGSLLVYKDAYFIHFPYEEAQYWGSSYKQLSVIVNKPEYKDKNIIISTPQESPYIYMLFYGNYDSALYQKQAIRYPISSDGFTDVKTFGRFIFRAIDWGSDINLPNTLLITKANEAPSSLSSKIVDTVYLPNGQAHFIVIDTNK